MHLTSLFVCGSYKTIFAYKMRMLGKVDALMYIYERKFDF